MSRFELYFNDYTGDTGYVETNPTREEIEACLAQTEHDECCFRLKYFFDGGDTSIELDSEHGEYRIFFFAKNGHCYTYCHPHRPKKRIDFAGDYAANSQICDDFNIIKEAFRQFIENQTISLDLLNN